MRLDKNSIVALATVISGSLVFYYIAQSITDLPFDALGASFFPKMAAIGLILFGVILFITSTQSKQGEKKKTGYTFKESMKILCFLLAVFLYIFFLPTVGFLLATALLIVVVYLILTDHWKLIDISSALIFSIVCSFVIWYVFTKQLGLVLP